MSLELDDVQGWVLRGYRMPLVRHLAVRIVDPEGARRWIGELAGTDAGNTQIQTAATWSTKPTSMVNIAFTAAGLAALGLDHAVLAEFAPEFLNGMPTRATKLGDEGSSSPSTWLEPYRDPDTVHAIVTVHGNQVVDLDAYSRLDDSVRTLITHDGAGLPDDKVVFGYRDNISQPRFRELHPDDPHFDEQPYAPLGVALLGRYDTSFEGLRWRVPGGSDTTRGFGYNGSFNAFRILRQNADEFDRYVADAATEVLGHPAAEQLLPGGAEEAFGGSRHDAMQMIVAAKLLGRWPNGNSLDTNPDAPGTPRPIDQLSRFDYRDDPNGQRCPIASHVRRANPRGATIVQRYANHTRRIIRRGMPYGPLPDTGEEGLLGNFIGASLSAQFEALMNDWVNVGMQDPRITGSNDPLLGANDPRTSWFSFPVGDDVITLRGFDRFIDTRGGAYTFIPGLSALRTLAAG